MRYKAFSGLTLLTIFAVWFLQSHSVRSEHRDIFAKSKLQEGEEGFQLSNVERDSWSDSNRWYRGGDVASVRGPIVIQAKGRPAFIWQTSWAKDWGVESFTPYLIIFDSDSIGLLTAFKVGPASWESRIVTHGKMQCPKLYTRYTYEFEPKDSTNPSDGIKETFNFVVDEGKMQFDLNDGRVFLIRKNGFGDGFVVLHLEVDLPPASTLGSIHKMGADSEEIIELFLQWKNEKISSQ